MLLAMKFRTSARQLLERLGLGLHAQDGQAGLELRRLDVGDQAPLEPGPQPVLEAGDLLGRTVRREDDLVAGAVERVEGVEELLLELLAALEELDVVDEQDVDLAVAAAEGVAGVVADRVDELVHQRLGGDVPDAAQLVDVPDVVADRVEEVGLAQPGGPVDEERVVGPGRVLGDRERGGVGEPVRRADHEAVEGVPGVQRGPRRRASPRRGRARPRARRRAAGPGTAAGTMLSIGARRAHHDGVVAAGRGVDDQLDRELAAGGVVEQVGQQPRVARADPLAGHRVRDREDEDVAVAAHRADLSEPGVPGAFGQLRAQRRAAGVPEVGRQRRHHGRRGRIRVIHRPIHKCGERTREARKPLSSVMTVGLPRAGKPSGEVRRIEAVATGREGEPSKGPGDEQGER